MSLHPKVQILDICDGINDPSSSEDVCILGCQSGRHDTGFMLPRLEVRVWEAEKDLGELASIEEVWQKLHSVVADTSDVLIGVVGQK